jgi:hypothetical protein
MFYRSMTVPEQTHIASALAFELAHVEIKPKPLQKTGCCKYEDSAASTAG